MRLIALICTAAVAACGIGERSPGERSPYGSGSPLQHASRLVSGTVRWAGPESLLRGRQIAAGVYELRASKFACPPGRPGHTSCHYPGLGPDRYEIELRHRVTPIHGLGMQASVDQVEVRLQRRADGSEQLLDLSFGSGHIRAGRTDERYNSDIGRLKTPVLVLPREKLIIAYLQPAVGRLRITRYRNRTLFVLKKHEQYREGTPAPLLLVRGRSIAEAYRRYYRALRARFFFKRPVRAAYGLHWETYNEFSMRAPTPGGATVAGLRQTLNRYRKHGIKPSVMNFGSGFWWTRRADTCSASNYDFGGLYRLPTIDSLTAKEAGLPGLLRELCTKHGIYPTLGMRHHAANHSGNALSRSGAEHLRRQLAARGVSGDPFLPGTYHNRDAAPAYEGARLLDTSRPAVMRGYIELIRRAYGPLKGLKEDEMLLADQKHVDRALPNLPAGRISRAYKGWNDYYRGDVVLIGRNDWFGVATDGQNGQGWVDVGPRNGTYFFKYALDSALTHVASGYPHPKPEEMSMAMRSTCSDVTDCSSFCNIRGDDLHKLARYNACCVMKDDKLYLRNLAMRMLSPIAMQSYGFWHVRSAANRKAALFFSLLRVRLQQYAYDQAMRWYETGEPQLMRPLFVDHDLPAVHALYARRAAGEPRDEFRFGRALLVRPLLSSSDRVKVYFPPGRYRPLIRAGRTIVAGPSGRTQTYAIRDPKDYPLFVEEGQLLLIADYRDLSRLMAYVFLDKHSRSSIYRLHLPGGVIRLQASRDAQGRVRVARLDSGKSVSTTDDAWGKGFKTADLTPLVGRIAAQRCTP